MRIKYINWATRKNFMSHTARKISNMRIEYITWAIRKNFMSHTDRKYQKG
jgi:hypothetical protein